MPYVGRSGEFVSEAEFEDQIIVPLLRRWDFQYRRQHLCRLRLGTQVHHGRVDFLVSDTHGPLTLFENKLRILNHQDRDLAAEQAKSYALTLGLPSFVVASPEGLWIYALQGNRAALQRHLAPDALKDQDEQVRDLLLALRNGSPKRQDCHSLTRSGRGPRPRDKIR